MSNSHNVELGQMKGIGAYKTTEFRDNELPATYWLVGPYETGKSKSMAQKAVLNGLEYPGIHIYAGRGTITDLSRTFIEDVKFYSGETFRPIDRQKGEYKFTESKCPVTGDKRQSLFTAISCGTINLQKLGSTEAGLWLFEEATEIPPEVLDVALRRLRQSGIYSNHATIYNEQDSIERFSPEYTGRSLAHAWAKVWNCTPEDAYMYLKTCVNNVYTGLAKDHPKPLVPHARGAFNDYVETEYAIDLWDRIIGTPHPGGTLTREWVNKNIGVKDQFIEPEEIHERRYKFKVTDIVSYPTPEDPTARYWVHTEKDGKVFTLAKITKAGPTRIHKKLEKGNCRLVRQEMVSYIWPSENESRLASSIAMQFQLPAKSRAKFAAGARTKTSDRVTPAYNDEFLPQGPVVQKEYLSKKLTPVDSTQKSVRRMALRWVMGIDDAPVKFTYAFIAAEFGNPKVLVIFDEYFQANNIAKVNASNINLIIPQAVNNKNEPRDIPRFSGADPQMWFKESSQDHDDETTAWKYQSIIGGEFAKGGRGMGNFDVMNDLFKRNVSGQLYASGVPYRVLISEECQFAREALRKVTKKMVRKNSDELIHVIDGLGYGLTAWIKNIENRSHLSTQKVVHQPLVEF